MTIGMHRILFACAMTALIAAGLLGPAGTLAKDLGSLAGLLDWAAVTALVTGVALWWLLPLHTETTNSPGRAWKRIMFPATVTMTLIVLHSLPAWTWQQWIVALSKTFPLLFAFVLWRQWQGQPRRQAGGDGVR